MPKRTPSGSKVESTKENSPVREKSTAGKQPATPRYTAEQQHSMIAESAYFRAEQRGFQGDLALEDWLRAEAELDALLSKDG